MATSMDFKVKNGLVVSTTATILGTNQSTSTTTGALIVAGGTAIAGNLNIFGNSTVGTDLKASLLTVNNTNTSALNIKSNAGFISPNSLNTITVRMLDSDVLTFNGAAGQLFSISDSFTGTIFAVNDISGVPSIEVYDTGLVSLAEFVGNVGIGTTSTTAKLTVNGGARISGITTVTNTSNATSTTTGALQIVGGVGIGGSVVIGNTLTFTMTPVQTAINLNNNDIIGVNKLVLADPGPGEGIDFNSNFQIYESPDDLVTNTGGNLQFTANGVRRVTIKTTGQLEVTTTTNATSTTTGALQISGGAGIGRDVWIGGSLNVAGGINATISGTITTATTISVTNDTSTTITQFISFVSGAATSPLGTALKIDTADLVFIPSTGRLGIGSLTPASKLDVTGDARISGITTVTNTTNATSTTTGALVVTGGAGIGGDLYVGGDTNTQNSIVNRFFQSPYSILAPTDIIGKGSSTLEQISLPTSLSGGPFRATVHPTGRFLYIIRSLFLIVYTINQTTGELTESSNVNIDFVHFKIHPTGRFLYALNQSGAVVRQYSINQVSGALTEIGTAIAVSSSPANIDIEPTGRFLYVSANGNINQFSINQTTGVLTSSTTFVTGVANGIVCIDRTGRFAYFNRSTGSVNEIRLATINQTTGELTYTNNTASITTIYYGSDIEIDSSNKFLYYSVTQDNRIYQYSINQNTGALISISSSTSQDPGSLVISPSGNYLYASNINSNVGLNGFTIFDINKNTGNLRFITTSSFEFNTVVQDLAIDPTERFLYVPDAGNNRLYKFLINTSRVGNFEVAGITTISGTKNSTSTTNGALVISGGVGIGQDLRVGGSIYGNIIGNATTVSTVRQDSSASHFLTFVDSNNASATAEAVYTTSTIIVNPSSGSLGVGTTPVSSARLTVAQTYTTATSSESFPLYIIGTYGVADTNLKQVIRSNYVGQHTTGTVVDGINILALANINGVGGSTTNIANYWSRIDNSTGTTVTNAYNIFIANGSGTGSSTNLYGLYVNNLTKGTSTNYAVYTAGTTPSYFGGNILTVGQYRSPSSTYYFDATNGLANFINAYFGNWYGTDSVLRIQAATGQTNFVASAGSITINTTTNATSTTTGALQVTGGVGIGGNLYVGGEIVAQRLTIELTTVSTTLVTTDDIIRTLNTSNATSTTTGALQVAGGAGIGGNIFTDGIVKIGNHELLGTNTWVRKYASGYSTTHTPTEVHEIGRFTLLNSSENITVTGEVRAATGASTGVSRFILGIRSNVLPNKSLSLYEDAVNLGIDIQVRVYENTATGLVLIGYTSPSAIQNIGWTLNVQERGNYNYLQQVTTLTTATTATLSEIVATTTAIQEVTGIFDILNSTQATTTNSGALQVVGGAGIGGNLFVGGNLNIAGSISGTLSGNAATVSTVQQTSSATHYLTFVDANNASATAESVYTTSSFTIIPSSGNVGIGTASPTARLTVAGGASITSDTVITGGSLQVRNGIQFYLWNSDTTNYYSLYNSGASGTSTGVLTFVQGGVGERLRLDNSGNLGINNISPTARLDIGGAEVGRIQAVLTRFAGDGLFTLTASNGNTSTNVTGSEVSRFGIAYNGNNTSTFSSGFSFIRGSGSTDGSLAFLTNATERARINSSGYFLIGTTSTVHGSSGRGTLEINGSSNSIMANLVGGLGAGYLYHDGNTYDLVNARNGGIRLFTNNTVRLTVDSSGRITGGFGAAIRLDSRIGYDKDIYYSWQQSVESDGTGMSGPSGTAPTAITTNTTASIFGKILNFPGYYEAIGDEFIPVNPGETVYGEIWAFRDSASTGTAGLLYAGIARYDKDKLPIATNQALNYFLTGGGGVTVPLTSTWTRYSGTHTLPTNHTPFSGSDGGPVRYIRPYLIVNYTAGTIPTQVAGYIIRRRSIYRDAGEVWFDNLVKVNNTTGATSTTTGALQVVGGVGIGGNLYVGGEIVAQRLTIELTTVSTTLVTTDDIIRTLNTSNATSTATGALQVSGGAGIGRDLYVGGTIYGNISGTLVGNAGTVSTVQQTSSASHFLTFVDSNNSSATAENVYTTSSFTIIPSSGNVGIGTTSPAVRLQISGGNLRLDNNRELQFLDTPGNVAKFVLQSDNNFVFYNSAGTPIWSATSATNAFAIFGGSNNNRIIIDAANSTTQFVVNGSERARINSSGNVGIANSSPSGQLHVGPTGADSSGIILGTFGHYYRYISVPAKTVATATSETFSFYFGRTTNGLTQITLYGAGWALEEGAQFEIHREWGLNSVPKIKARYGSDISEITWHFTTSTTDLYDLHLSYTYPAGVPTGTANNFRAKVINNGQGYFNVAAGVTTSTTSTNLISTDFNINSAGSTLVLSTANSISTTTGALQVTGGVGIGQDLRVGGTIHGNVNGNASQVNTIERTTNASHFVTFVDSNNSSTTAESVYTTSSFVINPNTGNVGVGTTSPTFKVDASLGSVNNNTGNFGYNVSADAATAIGYSGYNMTLTNSTANASGFIRLARTSSTLFLGMEIQSQSRDGIRFLTSSTASTVEAARIDALGNLLVGTSSSFGGKTTISSADTATTTKLYVLNSSSYGAGTATRGGEILLGKIESGTLQTMAAIEGSPESESNSTHGFVSIKTRRDSVLAERVRITSTGLVGVGTTNPQFTLDVNSTTNAIIRAFGTSIGRLSLQNSSRHYSLSVQGSTLFVYDETGGATRATLNSDGVLSITTTTNAASTTTGALVVTGGVGVGGDLYARNIYTNGSQVIPFKMEEFVATASQTTFTVTGGYIVGTVMVFANGIFLNSGDFTASNGTTVVLNLARTAGDVIKIVAGGTSSASNQQQSFSIAMSVALGM